MRVGLDFDNTIASYDETFSAIAVDRGLVETALRTKEAVRDHLRAAGREEEWTELQGYVYGPGMERVKPFPRFLDFLARCEAAGVETSIVSHKTRRPYRGPAYDLHASARDFLARNGIAIPAVFAETKEEKLERIGALGCTHFVDDLPEFLTEPGFPGGVERILFDPNESPACARAAADHDLVLVRSWSEAGDVLLGAA